MDTLSGEAELNVTNATLKTERASRPLVGHHQSDSIAHFICKDAGKYRVVKIRLKNNHN